MFEALSMGGYEDSSPLFYECGVPIILQLGPWFAVSSVVVTCINTSRLLSEFCIQWIRTFKGEINFFYFLDLQFYLVQLKTDSMLQYFVC